MRGGFVAFEAADVDGQRSVAGIPLIRRCVWMGTLQVFLYMMYGVGCVFREMFSLGFGSS